jgi:hypothetical protein
MQNRWIARGDELPYVFGPTALSPGVATDLTSADANGFDGSRASRVTVEIQETGGIKVETVTVWLGALHGDITAPMAPTYSIPANGPLYIEVRNFQGVVRVVANSANGATLTATTRAWVDLDTGGPSGDNPMDHQPDHDGLRVIAWGPGVTLYPTALDVNRLGATIPDLALSWNPSGDLPGNGANDVAPHVALVNGSVVST